MQKANLYEVLTERLGRNAREGVVTFLNPYSYFVARKHADLFLDFDEIKIDGMMLVRVLRLLGIRQVTRESFDMTSLAPVVFEQGAEAGKTFYLIGGEEGVAEEAVKKIKSSYPGLRVQGVEKGFFRDAEHRKQVIEDIIGLNPDVVIAGMGTPYQECFLLDLKNASWRGMGFTCGGFLRQTAKGGIRYYPRWVDAMNLRWMYRIYDEPKLLKRYLFYYPLSMGMLVFDYFRFRLK